MKAIRINSYGGPDKLVLDETPQPKLNDDEVLVKIHDAGVNPVDWKIRAGYLKERMPARFPLTMGQDIAGEIVEVGQNVKEFENGEAVFGFAPGAYAEFAAVKASDLAHKPGNLDFVTAASLPTAALTAWQIMMDVIKVREGQTVLIHGAAGGVGSFAVQLALWKRARVIATALRPDIDYLKSLGVDKVIDSQAQAFEGEVKDADAVVDFIGHQVLSRSFQAVKPGGIVVTTVGPMNEDEAKRRGATGVQFFMRHDAVELEQIARLVDQGVLKPRVDRVMPLADARLAQETLESGRSHGKIVLEVT